MDLNVYIPAILLIISEILPFIKHHESNGIMHLLYLILNAIITDQVSSNVPDPLITIPITETATHPHS